MNSRPVASIVIPTFNRAHLVSRAIDTALAQTVPCEVVVCDHGSTDDTPGVVSAYGDRIKYVRREEDNGPFQAWLDGIENARCRHIHLTPDDDWLDASFMEKCLGVFADNCAFSFSVAQLHFDRGTGGKKILDSVFDTGIHPVERVESMLLDGDIWTISPGCGVFRKEDALEAIRMGAPRSQYHGAGPDLLMFLVPLLKYSHFGFVNEAIAHFLAHSGSITIDASKSQEKSEKLHAAYADAKRYYLSLKNAARAS